MWLTFSTVAGGIYFHEFENAHTFQWIALIAGMMLNYFGLYHLVPTAADQPILIINMEKPPKRKVDDDVNVNEDDNNNQENITKPIKAKNSLENKNKNINNKLHRNKQNNHHKRKQVQQIDIDYIHDIDYGSDSYHSMNRRANIKKNIIVKTSYNYKTYRNIDDNVIDNDKEHETDDDDDDDEDRYSFKVNMAPTDDDEDEDDTESVDSASIDSSHSSTMSINVNNNNEHIPLLQQASSTSNNRNSKQNSNDNNGESNKWYQFFVAPK